MRLQQSHDFHGVIQRDGACDCHRCKVQLGYPRLKLKPYVLVPILLELEDELSVRVAA